MIAIGTKSNFNDPSAIQNLLKFIEEESTKSKTKPVRFICPKNNFHLKTYCFLGRRVKDDKEIGFSIIGSSNLTQRGLECEGELCISIHHLNLTKDFIYRVLNKYNTESNLWNPLKIKEYERQYNEKHSRKDQNEALPPYRRNGKFIKLGVLTDNDLITKATNLAKDSENIDSFHSSPTTLEQAKKDFVEGSLCLLLTENNIFQIVEIMPYSSDQENTKGCFVRYRKKVNYELSEDIREILAKEEYKIISDPKDMDELEHATLNMFENEVKEYQKMLADPNYKKGLEKGEEKMQSKINTLLEEIEKIDDPILKKRLKKLL